MPSFFNLLCSNSDYSGIKFRFSVHFWTEISAETERWNDTETETEMRTETEISAETDTETESFRSLSNCLYLIQEESYGHFKFK